MCVRYVGVDDHADRLAERLEALRDRFPGDPGEYIVPGGEVQSGQWGLQPAWAKDPKFGRKNAYNARSETVAEKPTFRSAFRHRRCLVPASAFFERAEGRWLRVTPRGDENFLIAGLWEPANELTPLPTFTMVTTEPNLFMAEVHDRMPVILNPQQAGDWMDTGSTTTLLAELMRPCPPEWINIEDAGPVGKPQKASPQLPLL